MHVAVKISIDSHQNSGKFYLGNAIIYVMQTHLFFFVNISQHDAWSERKQKTILT